jgi:1,2-diacylglycerol 3-beta-galactosyltransferase
VLRVWLHAGADAPLSSSFTRSRAQLRVLQRRRAATGVPAPPFATVVTDLTSCHPTWFHPGVTACFVPTEEVASQARRAGLVASQIIMHGLPIRPAFAAPLPSRPTLRKRLGLAPDGAVVLLVGGGEGMGLLEPTAAALGARLPPSAQIVVVCGRNAALAARLASKRWPCKMVVKGFVSNMDEWMGASDVVITKAGPGTIAEALIRGVPLMLNGAIPCQEEGNVPFVVEARARCACVASLFMLCSESLSDARALRPCPARSCASAERRGAVQHEPEGDCLAGCRVVRPRRR